MPGITRKRAREEKLLSITTKGKKARNEENKEGQITEVESCSVSEEFLGDGNTEIFSTLIPMMRNVNILKTCRLVCKSWNQFASRALRKHPRAYYSVFEGYPDKTENQLKLIVGNVHLGLPSPFRIFKVSVTALKEKYLLSFLKYLRESTSNFLVDLAVNSDDTDLEFISTNIDTIRGVKKLSIRHYHHCSSCDNIYKGIISHFAESLESLAGALPRLNSTRFPKLQEIRYTAFDFEFDFPVERYPLLRKATFDLGGYTSLLCTIDPLAKKILGIRQLSFTSPFLSFPEVVPKAISLAGQCFPKVSNFSVRHGGVEFTSEMLSAICESFPKLTVLDLWMKLTNDRILSGLPKNLVKCLHKGWPLESISRKPSLLDFPALQKLSLGSGVIVSRHLFLYCLSKIPKLQDLTFYLNGDISAIDVRDSVGHLKRITVIVLKYLNLEDKWVDEMERLQIMLPAVVEIK